jgi:hypothetical protein
MNIREHIDKFNNFINERLSEIEGTPIYHFTSTPRAVKIIMNNALKAGSNISGDYLDYDLRLANSKDQKAISFTRDKNLDPDSSLGMGLDSMLEDTDVIFVLDKDKLKTKYRVEPFDYDGSDPYFNSKGKNPEHEERVLSSEIKPLNLYVIDIIYKGNNKEVQKLIDWYLNK